jgi:8-oxo-dGTP pyrophosphatase MutT (NUDIX family)
MPKCGGFIILDKEKKQTILVTTPNGNHSFPKGKFEKKKDKSFFDCAIRELNEETGLTIDMIDIVPDLVLDEIKEETGLCSVQYWIGFIKPEYKDFKFDFDQEEIDSVNWIGIENINNLDKLKNSRKIVFDELSKLLNL